MSQPDGNGPARAIAKEVVKELFETLGVSIETPESREYLRRDFIWLRTTRRGSEDMSKWVFRSAGGIFISALVYALWSGIKAALAVKGG